MEKKAASTPPSLDKSLDASKQKSDSTNRQTTVQTTAANADKPNNFQFESNRKYFSICIYALVVITIGTFIIYCIINSGATKAAINKFTTALSPFLIAFFIAYMLNPIVHFTKHFLESTCNLKKSGVVKALSIAFTYLLVLGVLTITLFYIIPELGKSISDLSGKVELIVTKITEFSNGLEERFPDFDFGLIDKKINELSSSLMTYGTNMLSDVVPAIINFSVSIAKIFVNLLLSIVISVYMLNDKHVIKRAILRGLYAFFPQQKVDDFKVTARDCNAIFSNFIIGKSIDSLIIGVICLVAMSILRLPYAVLLSIIVGITNMIPYFGPFIGAVPGILLYLILDPIKALIFAIMIFALQQFDGLYLGPKILGDSTGLKPLWVIFAITVGGAYAGVIGMFLGVPVVGVVFYLCNRVITKRLKRKNLTI